MNILVTGAAGQLGREMQIVAVESADCYIFTDVCEGYEQLDITDVDAVRKFVADKQIEVIVNCAAWTNVDAAEALENREAVMALNASAPANLALVMKEVSGLLVHISTDYVFGAEVYNTPCTETMTGTPTGVYGNSKLMGEKAVVESGCNHLIIRTAWLYSEFEKNFVKTMLKLTSERPQVKVVIDQVGTPTYALDLAKAIIVVLNDYASSVIPGLTGNLSDRESYSKSGVYHYSNEGVCSWYDFARAIAGFAGNDLCSIEPCTSADFPSPVKRPAYSVLDKTKIKEAFGVKVPYWADSLKTCIDNLSNS